MNDDLDDVLAAADGPLNLPEGLENRIWERTRATAERRRPNALEPETLTLEAEHHEARPSRLARVLVAAVCLALLAAGAFVADRRGGGRDHLDLEAAERSCATFVDDSPRLDRIALELTANPAGAPRLVRSLAATLGTLSDDLAAANVRPTTLESVEAFRAEVLAVEALLAGGDVGVAAGRFIDAAGTFAQLRFDPAAARCAHIFDDPVVRSQ